MRLTIAMGAMAPPLREQVRKQGQKVDAAKILHLQKLADSITLLVLNDLIPESAAKRARSKLCDNVAAICFPA